MIERHKLVPVGDPLIQRGNPDYSDPGDACFVIEGKHYCPAANIMVGSSRGFVRVLQQGYDRGLYFSLTPMGARAVAKTLITAADRVDEQIAEAAAQLAATLAKKGQPE